MRVSEDKSDNIVLDCADGEPFAPKAALLGTLNPDGAGNPLLWMDPITENPSAGDTEVWELHTLPRMPTRSTCTWSCSRCSTGRTRSWKDTVIAHPEEVTRIKAKVDVEGLYVWHCHILEHEDNEMMRSYRVGPAHKAFLPITAK